MTGSAMAQSQAARGDLEFRYPDVRIADSREWVSSVFGVPMTWGETPRIAAEDWLASYAPVLVGDWCDLEYVSSLTLRDGRVSLLFTQTMDGLEVLDSRVKVLTHETDGGYRVGFVGAKLARDYETRLRDILVTAGEAELAAIQSERGLELDTFTEPELVARGAGGEDLGDARVVWRLHGWASESPLESFTFLVDAVTGAVSAESNVFHFTDTITGTVTGKGTPGLRPHIPEPSDCENEPVSMAIPQARVQLVDGTTVLKTVYTDANGDYTISLPSIPSTADVVFETRGAAWAMWELDDWFQPPSDLMATASYPVSGTLPEVIDHEFNSSPVSEAQTATVNAMIHIEKTWRFFVDRLDSEPPGLGHELEVYPHSFGPSYAPIENRLVLSPRTTETACPTATHQENSAYATVIAHEYSHYFLYEILGITGDPFNAPFHEGFADTVALLLYDTDEVGLDFYGCETCTRRPLADDPMYPVCYPFAQGCCGFGASAHHVRGELLSATWLDLRSLLGLSATRDLFVDWALIASGDRPEPFGCSPGPGSSVEMLQSADEQTLIEVLTADDDDNNITNGTPNEDDICAAFAGRNIIPSANLGVCGGESARHGRPCSAADLNRDGLLDLRDSVLFMELFAAGVEIADFDGSGSLDVFDQLAFQNAFLEGCR